MGDVYQSTMTREPKLVLGTTSAKAKASGRSHEFSFMQPVAPHILLTEVMVVHLGYCMNVHTCKTLVNATLVLNI